MVLMANLKGKLIKTTLLGIDIGYSIAKIAELERRNGDVSIKDYLFADFDNESEVPREEQAVDKIKNLLQQSGVKTKKVVAAVSNSDLIEKFLYFPISSKGKLEDIVKWEAKKHIDFPLEEAAYSFTSVEMEEEEKLCVYLAITKRSIVEKQIDIISRIGLEPVAIETKAHALARLVRWLDRDGVQEKKIALLDIGSKSSSFMLLEKGILRMSKYIEIGSVDITSTIVNLVHCSEEDARELQMNVGIAEKVLNNEESSPKSVDFNLYSAIEFQMDRLTAEMKRALMFYFAQFEWEGDPDILYITGGASRIPNIAKFLSKKLSMDVEVLDPVKNLSCPDCLERGPATHLSIAFGLALRGV